MSHIQQTSRNEKPSTLCLFMGEIRKTWPIYQRCGWGHEDTERGSVWCKGEEGLLERPDALTEVVLWDRGDAG
ncbi:hypothetical protein ABG768_013124, partial [Culter alburnus]